MIRRLEKRLTLLVAGVLLAVCVGVFVSINVINYRSISSQMYRSLDALLSAGGRREDIGMTDPPETAEPDATASSDDDPPEKPSEADDGKSDMTAPAGLNLARLSNSYTILLDAEGNVYEWKSDREDLYTDEQIETIAQKVLASGESRGRTGDQFYEIHHSESGSMLIVIDARSELSGASRVLIVTAAVSAAIFFLLSTGAFFLIRRMLRPVEAAFQKQKQFVWDASHELKTPIAVIAANADMLTREIGENEYLQYIRQECRATDTLVKNLLSLARMDSGTRKPVFSTFDLSRTLLSLALPFETVVYEAGKTLETDIPAGIGMTGDEGMIRELVMILLSNSLAYSDAGGRIRLSLSAKDGKKFISVWNTGDAIPPEAQGKVFDRFYRVDSAHNREHPGNGLGLSIAQGIAQSHQGKITLVSREGEGTTFTVVLPR